MSVEVRLATRADHGMLLASADLFDVAPDPQGLASFLTAPQHVMAIAIAEKTCVGFASAAHHLRPDQPPEMYIDDLGVDEASRRCGIATRLVSCLIEEARARACSTIWVLADPTDEARGFYTALGWAREGSHVALFSKELT